MFCGQCGTKLMSGAKFCQACGNAVYVNRDVPVHHESPEISEFNEVNGPKASFTEDEINNPQSEMEEELLPLFVGEKKKDFYLQKWSKGMRSWNWSAFFLGVFWLGYRKMYKPILVLIGLFLVLDLAVALLGIEATYLDSAITLGVGVTLGLNGNHLYRQHALKNIRILKKTYLNFEELEKQIKMRGNVSWKGVLISFGISFGYMLLLIGIQMFIPPVGNPEETRQVNATSDTANLETKEQIEAEITDLLKENITALENEDIEEYMSMIDSSSDEFEATEDLLDDLFNRFDLTYDISEIEFISVSNQEVSVRITQTTQLVDGDDFRDNESIFIHTLKPQGGKWRFFKSEVESVYYFDQKILTQTAEDSPVNALTLRAPEMFDFSITEEIDVDSDGIPERVTFQGAPEDGDSYVNENVEIIVEFDSGGRVPITVMAENSPVLYFYDIDQDGWLELFYETGYRFTTVDMYQFSPDGLEYTASLDGSIEEFTLNEVITSENTYPYEELQNFSFDQYDDEVDEESSSDESVETVTETPENGNSEETSLLLGTSLDDFLNNFIDWYSENLVLVESNASVDDYEFVSDNGSLVWKLDEDVMLVGMHDTNKQLNWVSITLTNNNKDFEKAAESTKIFMCATSAIISSLGHEALRETIFQNFLNQQIKESKDVGVYITDGIKYVDTDIGEATTFIAMNEYDSVDFKLLKIALEI